MKLSELAEIRIGESIQPKLLVASKPTNGNYVQFIEAANFDGTPSKFVSEKDLRKLGIIEGKSTLRYGDFMLVERNQLYSIFKYENSDTAIPANDIIVIQNFVGIVGEFFSYPKNLKYFLSQVNNLKRQNKPIEEILLSILDIEILTDDIRELDNSDTATQIGIRKPVDKSDLPFKLTQKPMSLDKLIKRINYNELLLDTEFQRRPGLWDIHTKSRFIEALIVRLPVPAFYFDGSNDSEWLVIDGLQRLSTVNSYINGEFALTNVDFNSDLIDKSFNELDRTYQRNIEEYEVFVYIIEKGTPPSVKYKVFKNINTSALKLESQEIRHAINPQKPAMFVKRVADSPWFKKYVPTSKQDRMYDREVVLRFIAFQRFHYREYKPSIVEFLDETMTEIYDIPEVILSQYEKDLETILSFINDIMGEPCYSKNYFLDNQKMYTHNNRIFELLTYGFSKIASPVRLKMLEKKNETKHQIIDFFKNQSSDFWDRDYAYTQEGLERRFVEIEALIAKLSKL